MTKSVFLILISFNIFSQDISKKGKELINLSFVENSKNNYARAYQILEDAILQCKKDKDTTNLFLAYNNLYSILLTQSKPAEFLKYVPELKKYENTMNFGIVSVFNNLGNAYQNATDFEMANYYYSKAITKISSYKQLTDIGYYSLGVNNNMASGIFAMQGDFDNALLKTQNSLANYLKIKDKFPEDYNEIGKQYSILGELFIIKKQFEMALKNLVKAPPYFQRNDFNVQITHSKNMAMIYLPNALNMPDSALKYISKAMALQKKFKLEHLMGSSYEILGNLNFQLYKFAEAEKNYNLSLNIRLPQKTVKSILQSYKNLSKTENAQQNHLAALQNIQKALQYNSTGLGSTGLGSAGFGSAGFGSAHPASENISENPKLETIKYKNDALEIYKEKVSALLAIYKKEGKKAYLNYAQNAINSVHELINYQRNSFQLEGSKLFLSEQAHAIYGLAIEAAFEQYRLTKDAKFIDLAFKYSESNKAVVLFESIKMATKNSFEGVPQPLIDQENSAIKNMAIYESQLYKDAKNESLWRKKLIDVTDELAQLKEKFKKKYPIYYTYKYNQEPIGIAEVQSKLSDHQSVIEYFWYENTLFTFLITKNKQSFLKQDLAANFKETIVNFRNEIIAKSISATYQKQSNLIFQCLFPAEINQFLQKEKIENLKIVADGLLNSIPFEALLTTIPKSLKQSNIYLLEQYVIGYLPSATMNWKSTIERNGAWFPNKYIGFAPNYSKGLALPINTETVSQLANEYSGDAYLYEKATKGNFEKYSIEKTKILHLSMHGGASNTDAMESYLAFEKDSVFVHDIYAKSVPADLALLDACETGVGILNNGEGVMSLARAFLHAGSRAVAMSLWKLTSSNETAEIIMDFVSKVENGEAKDAALRTAKLNYLAKHRVDLQLSQPFYWSTLLLVGNAEPIATNNKIYWLILLGLALSVGVIFATIKFKYKKV